jgi:peroxiredoxin Q/BCP
VEILYVSLDTVEQNAAFAKELDARTPVVSDPGGETAKRYGVLAFGGLYARRWTFYIDAQGILRDIDQEVDPATAGQDIVDKLEALGFPRLSSPERGPGAGAPMPGEAAPEGVLSGSTGASP